MFTASFKNQAAPIIDGVVSLCEQGRSLVALVVSYDGATPNTFDEVVVDDGEGNTVRCGIISAVQASAKRLEIQAAVGTGRLGVPIPAKHYRQSDARQVFSDLVGASGERVSPSTPQGMRLIHWGYKAGPAGPHLTALCQAVGWVWRTLPDGTIWAGPRRFALANTDALVVGQSAASRTVRLKPTKFDVQPATTLLVDSIDRNLLRVEYRIGENLDAVAWY